MRNKNDTAKEDIINLINMSLLTFPSSDLDLDSNSIILAEFLVDPSRWKTIKIIMYFILFLWPIYQSQSNINVRRVRQAALESVSLVASCLANQRIQVVSRSCLRKMSLKWDSHPINLLQCAISTQGWEHQLSAALVH